MSAEAWTLLGTALGTVVLFIVPALVYTWYAVDAMIGDQRSYAPVMAKVDGERAH